MLNLYIHTSFAFTRTIQIDRPAALSRSVALFALAVFIGVQITLTIIRMLYRRPYLNNLDVSIQFSADTVTEGDEVTFTEVLTNAQWLPLPFVSVKFMVSKYLQFDDHDAAQVSDAYYRNDLYHILMHQRITRRLRFTCSKRGYYRVQDLTLMAYDILMKSKHVRNVDCDAALTVYPGVLDLPEIENLANRIQGQFVTQRFIHPDPFTFRGIREYAPHDPMKSINFKASAKTHEMMVNLWDFSVSRQVVIFLNLQPYTPWPNEALDEFSIKVVSSLAAWLTERHIPVAFVTNGKDVLTQTEMTLPESGGMRQLRLIQEVLARIDLEQPAQSSFVASIDRIFHTRGTEPEYWIVSSYHGDDLAKAFLDLVAKGVRAAWILPQSRGIRFSANEINLGPKLRDGVIFV